MRIRTRRHRIAGFTLVELMVVVAIIGLLAAVVTVNVMGQSHTAKVERVRADMKNIGTALDLYKLACGTYPQDISGLWEAPGGNQGRKWKGPYLSEGQYPPRDPWGTEYKYQYSGSGSYELVSLGADMESGGSEEGQDLSSKTIFNQEN